PHVDEAVIKHVVYAGMGGSALAAGISQSWPGYQVPFEICRTYNLPQYVNHETLVIAASYSGNTEETLSALAEAEERGAHIAVIAGGGKLTEIAKEKHYTLLTVPKAEQPRYAVFYNFMALLAVLEAYKLVSEGEVQKQVSETAAFLEKAVQVWVPTVPSEQN